MSSGKDFEQGLAEAFAGQWRRSEAASLEQLMDDTNNAALNDCFNRVVRAAVAAGLYEGSAMGHYQPDTQPAYIEYCRATTSLLPLGTLDPALLPAVSGLKEPRLYARLYTDHKATETQEVLVRRRPFPLPPKEESVTVQATRVEPTAVGIQLFQAPYHHPKPDEPTDEEKSQKGMTKYEAWELITLKPHQAVYLDRGYDFESFRPFVIDYRYPHEEFLAVAGFVLDRLEAGEHVE